MNISGHIFEGPFDPTRGFTENLSVVYAILDDNSIVVDVGQTENINNRFPNHDRSDCWNTHCVGIPHLYILRVAAENDRLAIESQIRNQYNPACGER